PLVILHLNGLENSFFGLVSRQIRECPAPPPTGPWPRSDAAIGAAGRQAGYHEVRRDRLNHTPSDALVFFGATGDLAFKKVIPALQKMVQRGSLKVPVIGVAKAGW